MRRGARSGARRFRAPLPEVGGEDLEVITSGGQGRSRLDHGGPGSQGEIDAVHGTGVLEPPLPQSGIGAVVLAHPHRPGTRPAHHSHRLCHDIPGAHKQIAAPTPQRGLQVSQTVEQERQPVGSGEVTLEDRVVEDEERDHELGRFDRSSEGRVIVDSQVPVEQNHGRRHGLTGTIFRARS